MRKNSWLQKMLYGVMAVLGAYIMYKSGALLAARVHMQKSLDAGNVQQSAEDSAMRTWFPGYTASVEGKKSIGWPAAWFQQVVPVLSYTTEEESVESEENSESEPESERDSGNGSEVSETAQEESESTSEETVAVFSQMIPLLTDFSYLLTNYYTVDADTMVDAELLNAEELLTMDLSIEQDSSVPQILIYHTHSQEAFADSVEGEVSDTVVGMGELLADELRGYGYYVIHDTGVYDLVDGVLDRSAAYDYARESIEAILEEYPTIEVVIDLHRDGVEGREEDFVTEIDGEAASKIMFFNGLSRNSEGEALSWLPNAYLSGNLAFSLQLQVLANAEYPGFTRKIYLQAERYNLHLRARSLLIEAGTQLNTVEEEQNAMAPVAYLIWQVLSGAR